MACGTLGADIEPWRGGMDGMAGMDGMDSMDGMDGMVGDRQDPCHAMPCHAMERGPWRGGHGEGAPLQS